MLQAQDTARKALPNSLELCRLLNVRQMADGLGFSVSHFRRLYRSGKIPKPVTIGGGKLFWPASTLVALTGGQLDKAS